MLQFGLRSFVKNVFSKPNKDALWIFGNPKSGTTAITALLAKHTGKSVTLDTPYLWDPYLSKLRNKEISFTKHINTYSYPFSKQIIKEPNASLLFEELKNNFNLDSYVFIVRNPFNNIKSILNRLNLAGNKKKLDIAAVPFLWKSYFLPLNTDNYIETLALKWVEINSTKALLENDNCQIVKYEDFYLDKEKFIKTLARSLNFKEEQSIENYTNIQFQPKGKEEDNQTFFGKDNYQTILNVCANQMKYFGYKLENEY